MKAPCACWDQEGLLFSGGKAVCAVCGAKYDPKQDAFADETFFQEIAREVIEQIAVKREAQRIVDTKSTSCEKKDCGWWSAIRERNCYRDPGDCRYSEV